VHIIQHTVYNNTDDSFKDISFYGHAVSKNETFFEMFYVTSFAIIFSFILHIFNFRFLVKIYFSDSAQKCNETSYTLFSDIFASFGVKYVLSLRNQVLHNQSALSTFVVMN